jgi:hypothetical protein
MAHLDFKISSWKRIYIPDDKVEEVIEKLKNGDVDTPYDLVEEEGIYFNPSGHDEECEEPLTVEENDGASTQELYDNDGNIIYKNGTIEDN